MKTTTRPIAIVFFVVILILILFSFYSSPPAEYQFELIVKGVETEFWQSVFDGAKEAANTHGVNVTVHGPSQEVGYREQVDIMERSIERNPDAIILSAADYDLMAGPMEKASKAKIPVVLVDSGVKSEDWISFISTNNEEIGSMLAKELNDRINKEGSIGIVSFVKNSSPAVGREDGFRKTMGELSTLPILETTYCDSSIDIAYANTVRMISENPDITAIAALNAQSATGAARALSQLHRKDIVLAAIDCTVEEAFYMENGYLDVAIVQNPYLLGYYSVETAIDYLEGKIPPKEQFVSAQVVDEKTLFDEENQRLIFPFS